MCEFTRMLTNLLIVAEWCCFLISSFFFNKYIIFDFALRSSHVRHLIYPLQTILDDSIGCAIWFAARGRGLVTEATGKRVEYVSTARVRSQFNSTKIVLLFSNCLY